MKRNLFAVLVVAVMAFEFISCQSDTGERSVVTEEAIPAGNSFMKDTTAPSGILQWSEREALPADSPESWCKVAFDETLPLFPVTDRPEALFFNLVEKGVYVIIVSAGNTRSTFMLDYDGQDGLYLMCSEQAPQCLSGKPGFHMNPENSGFLYDAGRYLKYNLDVAPKEKGFKVTLSHNRGLTMGFRVRIKR